MSNLSWCDLNIKGNFFEVRYVCPSLKFSCRKKSVFTPNQFQPEGAGFKNKLIKIVGGTRKAWNKFNKPGLQIATHLISAAVAAKNKNPHKAQTASNILKLFSGGRIVSLPNMHRNGLRLRVM